jgi:hypothetical protein
MNKHLSFLGRLEAKHYRLIILLQFLIIAGLLLQLALRPTPEFRSQAQEPGVSESVINDVKACLSLSQNERGLCAEMVGKMVAAQTQDPKERLKACLAFRPHYYVYNCQLGLSQSE